MLNRMPLLRGQARGWEEAAVLSEQQQQALDLISEHCVQRPLPNHVRSIGYPKLPIAAGLVAIWQDSFSPLGSLHTYIKFGSRYYLSIREDVQSIVGRKLV